MSKPPSARVAGRRVIDIDKSLINKLTRAVNLAAAPFVENVGKVHRLSINEWRVLRTVAFAEGLSQQDISDRAGLDKMTVSRAVDRLVAAGRVTRRPDERDRRRSVVTMTECGWRVYAAIVPTALRREAEFLASLSDDERRALTALVDKLLADNG